MQKRGATLKISTNKDIDKAEGSVEENAQKRQCSTWERVDLHKSVWRHNNLFLIIIIQTTYNLY